jgi:hypothetical protein
MTKKKSPDMLVLAAKLSDDRLRQYSLLAASQDKSRDFPPPHFLPSLSCLADAVFHRYTGVKGLVTKQWADAMVLQYAEDDTDSDDMNMSPMEAIPSTEDEILHAKPAAALAASCRKRKQQ